MRLGAHNGLKKLIKSKVRKVSLSESNNNYLVNIDHKVIELAETRIQRYASDKKEYGVTLVKQ